jgi:hypothetical protein
VLRAAVISSWSISMPMNTSPVIRSPRSRSQRSSRSASSSDSSSHCSRGMVAIQGEEAADLDQQVVAQRAADAAVGHLDQAFLGPIQVHVAGDERPNDVDLAHVVHDHRHPTTLPITEEVVEERGLPCAEEAGEHGGR